MLRSAVVTVLAALALPAAVASAAPTALPDVERGLSAANGRCDTATYEAPISGFLDVRLEAATGDWDLLLRDGPTNGAMKASRGFGSGELVQGFVRAGQELVAQGCRRGAGADSARVSFRMLDVAPPSPGANVSLVRVRGGHDVVERLEAAGLDVTHDVRDGHADVLVRGAGQLDLLRRAGLDFATRVQDMGAAYADARRADARYAARVAGASPLPSGSTAYRDLDTIQAELKQLVADHPDRVRPVTIGTSFQGREISGVEIADGVRADDGRPVFFLMGVHHAREWPSAEAAMEFAHLLVKGAGDPRIAEILRTERVVIVPVVNVDGYVSSRESAAIDPADLIRDNVAGGEEDPLGTGLPLSTVESVVPPGGILTYRRKNCGGAIPRPSVPCQLQHGIDNNRNYGNLWGGNGASPDRTSQSYHGTGPRSEPETQAVWNFARTHQVTMLLSLHNVAALVLRPPGLAAGGKAPDEARMKEIGDAMGEAAGYTSQYSFQLYDTAGTTEDDTYAATGGYGFTIEIGPEGGAFHMPYETGFVKEWTGEAAGNGKGLREALLIAAEAAGSQADHAVLTGTAPAGRTLRLHKSFVTQTSEWCGDPAIDPVLTLTGGPICPAGRNPAIEIDDELDATTVVPAGGRFAWHVNPSTRPFVGGGAVTETLDAQPYASESSGPTPDNRVPFTVGEADADGAVKVTLTPTIAVEDYDLEVYRVDGGAETQVASSGNPPGAATEEVVLSKPAPGRYVAQVVDFLAVTSQWTLAVDHFKTTREVSTGTKEVYTLTCEDGQGTVLERHELVVDRGQTLDLALACGESAPPASGGGGGGGGTAVSAPAAPAPGAPADATPAVDGRPVTNASASTQAQGVKGARAKAKSQKKSAKSRKRQRAKVRCRAKAKKIQRGQKRRAALRRCARRF